MADPCASRIVHPVYPGGDAGFLFRSETFISLGAAGSDTGGILHWTPGYPNASNTELLAGTAVGPTTGTTCAVNSGAPGRAFLGSNAHGARCIAACLKITYSGSESSRSGRVHYGHTQAAMIDAGEIVTINNVAEALQHYTRTPPETIEIFWKPNLADCDFCDPSVSSQAQIRDRKSSITVAFTGLPISAGLTFHMTAVYEWTPRVGLGVASNALGKSVSKNTLDEILDFLTTRGFVFVKQAGMAFGHAAGDAFVGAMASTYGLMSARRRGRALTFGTS